MSALISGSPRFQAFTNAGAASGYQLFTYETGTTTKKTTYSNAGMTAANSNPVVLDSNGSANIYLNGEYTFVLAPPTDTDPPTSPIWTVDNIIVDTTGDTLIPQFNCRFDYTSSTVCTLSRCNGSKIYINGSNETIPAAGVTLSNSGLANSTLYYAYVYMNATVMTLEASTTAPTTDTTNGYQVKTGDSTRTLVGKLYTSSGGEFLANDSQNYLVLSYYNRLRKYMVGVVNGSSSSNSASKAAELNYLIWDDDYPIISTYGYSLASSDSVDMDTDLYYGLSTNLIATTTGTSTANRKCPFAIALSAARTVISAPPTKLTVYVRASGLGASWAGRLSVSFFG